MNKLKNFFKKHDIFVFMCIIAFVLFLLVGSFTFVENRTKSNVKASAETSYGMTYINTDYYYFQRSMFYSSGSTVTYLSRVTNGFSFRFSYGYSNTFQLSVNLGSAGGVQTFDTVSLTSNVHRTLNRNGSNQYLYFVYQYDALESNMYFTVPYGFKVFNRGLDGNINIDLGMSPTYPVYYIEVRFLFEENSKQVASLYIPFNYNAVPTDFDLYSKTISFASVNYSADELLIQEAYNNGYQDGYNKGINTVDYSGTAFEEAYNNGYQDGYELGERNGKASGYNDGMNSSKPLYNLVSGILDAPVNMVKNTLDFEVLGVNLSGFFFGLLTLIIIICVIRKFSGG